LSGALLLSIDSSFFQAVKAVNYLQDYRKTVFVQYSVHLTAGCQNRLEKIQIFHQKVGFGPVPVDHLNSVTHQFDCDHYFLQRKIFQNYRAGSLDPQPYPVFLPL